MTTETSRLAAERREYLRLDSVFPVQFCLLGIEAGETCSEWLQGFSNNIGKGGICLEVNNLKADFARSAQNRQVKFSLAIEIPLLKNPVNARAVVSWMRPVPGHADKYAIGLRYEQIDPRQNKLIMRYAWAKKLFAPAVLVAVLILGLGFVINAYINVNLIQGNRALVEQLVKILQETSIAKQKIKDIDREKEDLRLKIQTLQLRIQALDEERERRKEEAKTIGELSGRIESLTQEKSGLQEELIALQRKESAVTEQLLRLDQRKVSLEQINLDKMYQWLQVHQHPRTGLVESSEAGGEMAEWAFTFDQALAVQAYTNFSDFERARKILDFFMRRAESKAGLFFNAYSLSGGHPLGEAAYSGPSIWLGIAVMQYSRKSQDNRYRGLAETIARSLVSLQGADGSFPGGPDIAWRLIEHNLDGYAFFTMLSQTTSNPEYAQAKERVLAWLTANINTLNDPGIIREKGDATIVADTHLWAVVALGPEKLEALGINPERIVEFAEENFVSEVTYTRPEGQTIKIRGFDFAVQQHAARGGVVFPEWTAQAVIAFQALSDFYFKKGLIAKARSYEIKADEYLSQLGNMIISSPSPAGQGESCLPFATHDFVDTGHGWVTPKGKSTGSLSATAYTLFAYYKYNPLELK